MKKLFLVISILTITLSANSVIAQIPGVSTVTKMVPKPLFGLKVGGNFTDLSTSGTELTNKFTWPSPGIFASLRLKGWGLRVEGLLNFAKYDYSLSGLRSGTFNNIYLDIPVLIEYRIIPRIWAQAGLQFSRTLSVDAIASGNTTTLTTPKDYFQPNSYSIVLGAEALLPLHFVLGARYILGFTDINNPTVSGTTNAWKAKTAQIYIGFRFI